MRRLKHSLWLVTQLGALLLLWAGPAAAQTNPCTANPPSEVVNPHTVYARLPEFNRLLPNDTTAIPSYEVGWMIAGATQPIQSAGVIAKAGWTLVPGTADCYSASLPGLVAMPVGQTVQAAVRALGDPSIGSSAWSEPSNPFRREGPPAPPGRPVVQ